MIKPHPLKYHIQKKMNIRKVKADQLTHLEGQGSSADPPSMSTLYLQSGLKFGVQASGICVELFGNIYFIYLIPN